MSSASNLSWCTADNEPDECVQFLGHSSNGHKEDLKVSYVVDNEFRSQKKSSNIQNDGRACASVVQIEKNTTITGYCCCCKNTLRIVRRITELYTLKMPWIIVLLSIVQVIIYFIACNDSIALLIFKPQRKYDLWRFITYHAVHFNLTHLLLNVALQILIALPIETTEGHTRVLIVYFSGVIFGAIGSMLLNPTQSIVGSSGGVYSLLFSHISQCTLNWTQITYRTLRLVAILMLFLSDVLFLVLKHIYWSSVEPKISFSAHISGGMAGYIAGLIIFKKSNSLQTPPVAHFTKLSLAPVVCESFSLPATVQLARTCIDDSLMKCAAGGADTRNIQHYYMKHVKENPLE